MRIVHFCRPCREGRQKNQGWVEGEAELQQSLFRLHGEVWGTCDHQQLALIGMCHQCRQHRIHMTLNKKSTAGGSLLTALPAPEPQLSLVYSGAQLYYSLTLGAHLGGARGQKQNEQDRWG